MWKKDEMAGIYENQPEKDVRLGRYIGPILFYYIVSVVAQIIWGIWAIPRVLLEFIGSREEIMVLMPSGYDTNVGFDLIYEFLAVVDENIYMEFLYSLAYSALENVAEITILSALLSIPFFIQFMGKDKKKNIVYRFKKEERWPVFRYGFILIGGVLLCIALNNMITLSDLAQMSEAYQETSEALYSIDFLWQFIGLGIIVPMFEELLYRGVIYNRMKVNLPPIGAVIVSALIFGTMHGNMVQIIYATVLGVVFAWLYDVYKSIWAPILAHMIMNMSSIILSKANVFDWIFEEPMRMGLITVACATGTAVIYVMITNIMTKSIEIG